MSRVGPQQQQEQQAPPPTLASPRTVTSRAAAGQEISGRYDDFSIAPGFQPDPLSGDGLAGGPRNASDLRSDCRGQIAAAGNPDHVITLEGDFPYLSFRVTSQEPTSLILRDPAGNYTCVASQQELQSSFAAGVYQVFVANPRGEGHPQYRLHITEYPPEHR